MQSGRLQSGRRTEDPIVQVAAYYVAYSAVGAAASHAKYVIASSPVDRTCL